MGRRFAAVIVSFAIGVSSLFAQEARVALIVGNSNYEYFGNLANPMNDARDVGVALESLGFEVTTLLDATERELINAIRSFGAALSRNKGIGLFYYAGHGIESEGKNYLIPVDADIRAQDEVRFSSIELDLVLSKMESARNPTNIVILDACRDNPLPAEARSSASRGLSIVDAPTGSLIVYATQPGNVASDGSGRNSPFTEAFLEHVATPAVDVELMFRNVRGSVMEATANQQVPWTNSSLTRSVMFVPARVDDQPTPTPTPSPQPGPSIIVEEYGTLTVDVATAGDLYLNGQFMTTATAGARITIPRVPAGSHLLEMEYSHGTEQHEALVQGGASTPVRFTSRDTSRQMAGVEGLSIGGELTGNLSGDEPTIEYYGYVDWYPLSVTSGQPVTVTLSSFDYDTYLVVRMPDGRELTNDDSNGTDSALTFVPEQTMEVQVGATSFYSGDLGQYTLSASSATIEQIGIGQAVSAYLGSGEQLYTLGGTSGQTVRVTLTSDEFDTRLEAVDTGGESYYNDDFGDTLNSQITISFPNSGQAQVTVRGHGSGRYTLTTEEIVATSFQHGYRLSDGDELTGRLSAQLPERDGSYYQAFTFEAESGERVVISLASDSFDSYLRLVAPDGSEITDDDSFGNRGAQISTTISQGGVYEVQATSYWEDEVGVYTLHFDRRSVEQSASAIHGELTVGGEVNGNLSGDEEEHQYYGYVDWFPLAVEGGLPITVSLASDDFDPYLTVRLPNGEEYSNDDADGWNSSVTFVPEGPMTVEVMAAAFFDNTTGSYTLSADTEEIEELNVDSSTTGRYTGADVLYTLPVEAGQAVRIALSSDDYDPAMELFTPEGESHYADDHGASTDAELTYQFSSSGDARLHVRGWGSGTFRVIVRNVAIEQIESGHRLVTGDRLVGSLGPDHPTIDGSPFQLFTFEASRGERVTVSMESAAFDSYLRVVGPDGSSYEDDDSFGGRNASLTMAISTPGIYQLYARSFWGDDAGLYTVSFDRLAASRILYDSSGSLSTSDSVDGGSYFDVHEFSVAQAGTVTIDVLADSFDGYARLEDESGREIASNDDGGTSRNPRIEERLQPGRYRVIVTTYYDDEVGDYQVVVTQ